MKKDEKKRNEKVYPYPNPKDKNPMYITKRVRHDKKVNFGKKYPWSYKKSSVAKGISLVQLSLRPVLLQIV